MEPGSNQELPEKYPPNHGAPPKQNLPERPTEPLAERDLQKEPTRSEPQPEFGPIPDVAARKTGEPVPLWSSKEMVSDAEAAQATLKSGPVRRVFPYNYLRLALVLIVAGLLGLDIHRMHENQLVTVAVTLRQQADRDTQSDGSGTGPQEGKMTSAGNVNIFAAEILFGDPDLEYRMIFQETRNPDGTPSRTFGSDTLLFQTPVLTEEQTAFFNAVALNAG